MVKVATSGHPELSSMEDTTQAIVFQMAIYNHPTLCERETGSARNSRRSIAHMIPLLQPATLESPMLHQPVKICVCTHSVAVFNYVPTWRHVSKQYVWSAAAVRSRYSSSELRVNVTDLVTVAMSDDPKPSRWH